MILRTLLLVLLAAVPAPAQAADPVPRIQRLGDGDLPIVPCAAGEDTGCVEVLFDGPQPPVACWSVQPFGPAGVAIDTTVSAMAGTGTTRRLTIRFTPLGAVPAASPVTLRFGFPQAGRPLDCDQALVVTRPASVLALPSELDLGVLHVDLWGRVAGADLVQPVFPAAGQPPVGPMTVSSGVDLHAADRRGSPVPVRLDLPDAATVTAARFAELRLSPGAAGGFPALGPLSGNALLTAPQLAQPLAVKVTATGRIGWLSILLVLVAGIAAGAVVHRLILPRQALDKARLAAARAALAAGRLREGETDTELLKALDEAIAAQQAEVAAATDAAAVTEAVERMNTAVAARLEEADAARQALAAQVAPLRAALAVLPAVSDLPAEPLDAWQAGLDAVQAGIDAREIARPRAQLAGPVAAAQKAALAALEDFAAEAGAVLGRLDLWVRAPAVAALAPLSQTAPGFVLATDAEPVAVLTQLRNAWHDLRRAAATGHPAIADQLRAQAEGAANAGLADAPRRSEAILDELPRRPLAALAALDDLVDDYRVLARDLKLAGFEALADTPASGAEAAALDAPPSRRPPVLPPEEADLALLTEPRTAIAGREVTIRLVGLPVDRGARIRTPYGSARIAPGEAAPALTIRPPYPGRLTVEVAMVDEAGLPVARASLPLMVQPAPELVLEGLTAEVRRSDRLALAAAAGLALLSGAALFSVVPLTSWWALLAPLLWGFFVNLNLPDAITDLRTRRDAVFKANNIA